MKKIISVLSAILFCAVTYAQSIPDAGLQKLVLAQSAISSLYVDQVDDSVLVESAIRAMLEQLDPHSTYLTAAEVERSNEVLDGNFEGIGIQYNMLRDTLFIIQTIPDGPCERVGIMPGDRIITADDTLLAGRKMDSEAIMKYLRGPKGTHVKLGVLRHGVEGVIDFDVVRDRIPLTTIDASYMVKPGLAYIKVSSFGATTVDEFIAAWDMLRKRGAESLILDLQGNGGGYLGAAVGMANEFLDRNRQIVYTGGRASRNTSYMASGTGHFRKGDLAVLINEYSASASEIVSGALQDWDRAVVIGRRSFGKGLVQRPVEFPDGSMMRLTVAKYFTPSGRCIQKPYGDDVDYMNDISERLASGQLTSADSIHFSDSLKYQTKIKKRTVYGGGGIMPDIFVPIDTAGMTPWYRQVMIRGAVIQSAISYVEEHRDELLRRYRNFDRFDRNFDVDGQLLDVVRDAAATMGIAFNREEYDGCLPVLTVQLKALVARNLWSMNEYYSVLNILNPVYCRAVEYMESL